MSEPLKVGVVSPHQLTRAGVARLLDGEPGRVVVVGCPGGDVGVGGLDVAVYDLADPGGSARSDLARLLGEGTPVLGLEPLDRPDRSEAALTIGVADVVPYSVSGPELLAAVERVARGEVTDRPDRHATAGHATARDAVRAATGLTEREAEILALIASGLANLEIAERLFLSINSVKTYVRTAYRKIGVTGRSEAVLWAVRHHLVAAGGAPDAADASSRT